MPELESVSDTSGGESDYDDSNSDLSIDQGNTEFNEFSSMPELQSVSDTSGDESDNDDSDSALSGDDDYESAEEGARLAELPIQTERLERERIFPETAVTPTNRDSLKKKSLLKVLGSLSGTLDCFLN